MPRALAIPLALLAPAWVATLAQSPAFRPVDPNTSDANPLAVSQRLIPADLRVPTGFDRVYELIDPRHATTYPSTRPDPAGVFFRASGGLVLSFPRSSYVPTRAGALPVMPPGATYSLGLPRAASPASAPSPPASAGARPAHALPAGTTAFSAQRAQPVPSLASAAPARATFEPSPAPQPEPRGSIWLDPEYRALRLSALIEAARLRAATPPAGPGSP